ncbi:hypothetical protein [Streptomyces sp. NPDC127038]|uniref:hypothetical protein n=1 Tax=Streptomyces sp. NPDC127038 TaxID=3347114 RepID=UPI00364A2A50
MSTGGSLPERPSKDATAVPYGRREARTCVVVASVSLGVAAAGLTGAALVDGAAARWTLVVGGGLVALFGVLMLIAAVVELEDRFVFDATGWWWFGSAGDTLLTWDSLAGVCVHSTGDAAVVGGTATLELFPHGDLDRDHPLLWRYVRDATPPVEGLPRLRYRIELTRMVNVTTDVEQACSRWAPPGLWHGNIWQPKGYKGRPDHGGHRRRMRERERAQALTPAGPEDDAPRDGTVPPEDAVPPGPPRQERSGR